MSHDLVDMDMALLLKCATSHEVVENKVEKHSDGNQNLRVADVPVPEPFTVAAKPKTPEELNVAIEAAGGF
jgi:hypothetical protein